MVLIYIPALRLSYNQGSKWETRSAGMYIRTIPHLPTHFGYTGMDFLPGEVPVCFEPVRRSAGMAYRCITIPLRAPAYNMHYIS